MKKKVGLLKLWTMIFAMLFISIVSLTVTKDFPALRMQAQSGYGQIKTTDYGTTPTAGGAFYWRGYSFKVSTPTVVTHLIGGGNTATASGFQGAILSANTDVNGNAVSPQAILAIVNFTGNTVDQVVPLSSSITLQPNTWYYLAQGDTGGSPTVYHHYVESLNADDLVAASYRISNWMPGSSNGCHYWSYGDPNNVVVGIIPSTDSSRPAIGFRYESSASLPVVETTTTPMYGLLTNRGNAPTALYIEYGTSPNLLSNTVLNLSHAGYEGTVPYTYGATAAGLSPSTTYYYRARAINDAGRVEGVIRSFNTPAPPSAPTITSIAAGNGQLTVYVTPPPGSIDNYQYSLNNGSTWLSRSPASPESPLVISGLTNGTTYSIRLRAVYQGIIGAQSNMLQGMPTTFQTITFPSIQTKTYGDADFSPGATSSSGLPVSYSSSNPDVAVIFNNQIRIVGQGTSTITATQEGDASFGVAAPVSRTLTVTRRTLTLGGTLQVADKIYDGSDTATVSDIGALIINNKVGSDDVSIIPVAKFADKNVSPSKLVMLESTSELVGANAGNYILSLAGAPDGTAAITARPLSLSNFFVDNKVYDGTLSSTGGNFSDNRIHGDDLEFNFEAYFTDADANESITVEFTNISISGGLDAANYILVNTFYSTTADITLKTLTITLHDKSKTYGQTDPVFTASYDGFVNNEGTETLGDVIIYRHGGENIGMYDIGIFILNQKTHNYTITELKGTFVIEARQLTLINRQAADKEYNGLLSTTASADLSGILPGEEVELVLNNIRFNDKNVGTDKSVYVDQTLAGSDAGNYILIQETPFATADISIRTLTLSQFSANNKVYDGTTSSIYTYTDDRITGDNLNLDLAVNFSDHNIGQDKTVTLVANSIGGSDAGNYTLATTNLSTIASITPIILTVNNSYVEDKIYDATREAIISGAVLQGVLPGESVTLAGHTEGQFSQKEIGQNLTVLVEMYLVGDDVSNYILEQPTLNLANILPKTLTVTGAIAQGKDYDGTNIATITGAQLSGAIVDDDIYLINFTEGIFMQSNVGEALIVNTQMDISGQDAGNYILVQPTLNTASIIPRELEVKAVNKVKNYGQIDPPLTVSFTGFALGEDQTDLDGNLIVWRQTGENVGTYEIRLASTLSSPNYTIIIYYGTLTIQPRVLLVTGAEASDKTYDGNTSATINGSVLFGVLPQDEGHVTLIRQNAGDFEQSDAGTGILIITDMGLSGEKSDNYSILQPVLYANITRRAVSVSADSKSKTYGEADPQLTYEITDGSLVAGDSFSGSLVRNTGENVGVYDILQNTLTLGNNYELEFAGNKVTVEARLLTIKAVNLTKAYGEIDPLFDVQYINLAPSDTSEIVNGLSISRTSGSTIGSYTITPKNATADNYIIKYEDGTLTILPKQITITANPLSRKYGKIDPELSYIVSLGTLESGDSLIGQIVREFGENIGIYKIMQGTLTAGENYLIDFVEADFVITEFIEEQQNGIIRNGNDEENNFQISYVAESKPGYGFAYWSDGTILYSTDQILINPAKDISSYNPVFWPQGETTEQKTIQLSKDKSTTISFHGDKIRMILPKHKDSEAVFSVTVCEQANSFGTPEDMLKAPLYYCLLYSENLNDESIRLEISFNQSGVNLKHVDVSKLQLFHWNDDIEVWEQTNILSQGVDIENKIVWAEVNNFSTFGVFYPLDAVETTKTGDKYSILALLLAMFMSLGGIITFNRKFKKHQPKV